MDWPSVVALITSTPFSKEESKVDSNVVCGVIDSWSHSFPLSTSSMQYTSGPRWMARLPIFCFTRGSASTFSTGMSMFSSIRSPDFQSLITAYPFSIGASTDLPFTDNTYFLHHPGMRRRISFFTGAEVLTVSLTCPSHG